MVHYGGRSPLCRRPSRNPKCRRRGLTGVYPCLKPLFSLYILFIYLYIIYYIKHICQINPAHAHAPAKPKPDATNGHSNINAASTANIRKVFHNVSIARGVEPPVSPPAYGTGVNPCKTPPTALRVA